MNQRIATSAIVALAVVAGASGGYALRASKDPGESMSKSEQRHFDVLVRRIDRLAERQEAVLSSCAGAAEVTHVSAPVSNEALPPSQLAQEKPVGPDQRPEPDPAVEDALAMGHKLLDHALSIGSWTEDDVIELRHSTAPLNAQQQQELFMKLAKAINEGRIKYLGAGSPM
jgi:hypothetical protein